MNTGVRFSFDSEKTSFYYRVVNKNPLQRRKNSLKQSSYKHRKITSTTKPLLCQMLSCYPIRGSLFAQLTPSDLSSFGCAIPIGPPQHKKKKYRKLYRDWIDEIMQDGNRVVLVGKDLFELGNDQLRWIDTAKFLSCYFRNPAGAYSQRILHGFNKHRCIHYYRCVMSRWVVKL